MWITVYMYIFLFKYSCPCPFCCSLSRLQGTALANLDLFSSQELHTNTNTFENLHPGYWPVFNSGLRRQAILGFYLKSYNWWNKIYRNIFSSHIESNICILTVILKCYWYVNHYRNILTFYHFVYIIRCVIKCIASLTCFSGSPEFFILLSIWH